MELHYEEGNTLRGIIISHQPGEKQNLTVVKISPREDFSLCLWRFRERGKEANEWLAKKNAAINFVSVWDEEWLYLVLCLK